MGTSARAIGDKLLRISPGQAALSRRASSKLTVLAYHGIDDAEFFGRQLDYLSEAVSFVSLEQVLEHVRSGTELPRRPALVTFDDGDPSVLTVAAPELSRRGIPAVAFVVPGYLGTNQPFWWEEVALLHDLSGSPNRLPDVIRELKRLRNDDRLATIDTMRSLYEEALSERKHLSFADLARLREFGIEVGNHSHTHPILTRCSPQEVHEEIGKAHHALEERLGHPIRAFAYPNGDHNSVVVEAVRKFGYEVAFCFDHSLQGLPVRDPLRISRVRVSSTTSIDRLSIIVSGLHPWLHRMAGRS